MDEVLLLAEDCWSPSHLAIDVLTYPNVVVACPIGSESTPLTICCIYRPPSQNENDGLLELIPRMASLPDKLLLMSDCNVGNINWAAGKGSSETSVDVLLLIPTQFNVFAHYVMEPTKIWDCAPLSL